MPRINPGNLSLDASMLTSFNLHFNFSRLPEGASNLRPRLAANVEKARSALTKLQEAFQENPSLQTGSVMKQLLDVLKDGK